MICSRCTSDKEARSFHIATRKKDGTPIYRKYCNECYKEVKDKRKVLLRAQFIEYKRSLSCHDCGLSFMSNHWLCEFHHLDPAHKEQHISGMIYHGSWSRMMKEIEKCIPLCCNCHRTRHYNESVV